MIKCDFVIYTIALIKNWLKAFMAVSVFATKKKAAIFN